MTNLTVLACHPSSELYGADRQFLRAAQSLAADGIDVRVILGRDGPLLARLTDAGLATVHQELAVLTRAELSPRRALAYLAKALKAVIELSSDIRRTRPDLVYVNTLTVPSVIVAARLARVPVICHVREAEPDLSRLIRAGLTMPVRLATSVLVNSEFSRATLGWKRRALGRVAVLYNGYPVPEQMPERVINASPRVLVPGRLNPRKGQREAILAVDAAAKALGRAVELELVGSCYPGWEWYEEELHEVAERVEQTRVSFRGFVADLPATMHRYDLVVVPSKSEPFGGTAVEAALAGVPLVVSDSGGLKEIAQRVGIRHVAHVADLERCLARSIADVLEDYSEELKLAQTIRTRAIEAFGEDRYRAELLAHVKRVARR